MDCILLIERQFFTCISPNSDVEAKGFRFASASAFTSNPDEGFHFSFASASASWVIFVKLLFFFFEEQPFWKIYFRGWVFLPKIHVLLEDTNVFDTWSHKKRSSRRILHNLRTKIEGYSKSICYLHSKLFQPKYILLLLMEGKQRFESFLSTSYEKVCFALLPLLLPRHCCQINFFVEAYSNIFFWILTLPLWQLIGFRVHEVGALTWAGSSQNEVHSWRLPPLQNWGE